MESIPLTERRKRIEFDFPPRPHLNEAEASRQAKVKLVCNLVKLKFSHTKPAMQLSVSFEPFIEEENFGLKCLILRNIDEQLKNSYGNFFPAGETIFAIGGTNADPEITFNTQVNGGEYKVTVKKTNNFISPSQIRTLTRENIRIKNFIENIMRNVLAHHKSLVKFDKENYFDYTKIKQFGKSSKSIIWKGFSTAILITDLGICIRANDRNKMLPGKNALEKMDELNRKAGKSSPSENQPALLDYFKNKTVVARYGSYRAYKIGDIAFEHTVKNTTFPIRKENGDEEVITVEQYYKRQYGITIKNTNQPLFIELEPRRSTQNPNTTTRYLVPELMDITGLDDLSEEERADIIAMTKQEPTGKVELIKSSIGYLFDKSKKTFKRSNGERVELKSPDEIRQEWGLELDGDLLELNARVLSVPSVEFGNNATQQLLLKNGRFNQQQVKKGVNFTTKDYLLITWRFMQQNARRDCENLIKSCGRYGYTMQMPTPVFLESTDKNQIVEELRKFNYNHGTKIVLVIVDNKTKHLYPIIKHYLFTQVGIPNQFMVYTPNAKKRNPSYFGAVANQMVVKCEGELFNVKFNTQFAKQPSMIIGLDASKRLNGQTKYVISASYNSHYDKFYTDYETGGNKEEPAAPLTSLLTKALAHFRQKNNTYPKSIIIYRTGGNQRQVVKMAKFELPVIRKVLEGGIKECAPTFALFAVNKNSDLKFFQRTGPNSYANTKTGTVIDSQVTEPNKFEFYLQGPDVNRGTASPTHYLCIYNTIKDLSLSDYEEIAYKQSFYYWNWCGPIRIPAALKYAEVSNLFSNRNLNDSNVVEVLKKSPYFI